VRHAADGSKSTMTAIHSSSAPSYRMYAKQSAVGHLASSAAAAVAAEVAQSPTEMNRRDLHATLGKNLDAAA
jgi:hypothetical protein